MLLGLCRNKKSLLLILLGVSFWVSSSCSAVPVEMPEVVGKKIPIVSGEDLNGNNVGFIPAYWEDKNRPTVVLVGYEQESQFDCDRWILGLLQLESPVDIVELPTIPGLVPLIISSKIDSGMRRGIPSQDWGSVVTLYGESATIMEDFLGNNHTSNAHVMLVSSDGEVKWTHNKGYSASLAMEVDELSRSLK